MLVISNYAGQLLEPLSKSGVEFFVISPGSYDALIVGANLSDVREETCERIRRASVVVLYRSSQLTSLRPFSAPEHAALADALSRGAALYAYLSETKIPEVNLAKAEVVPVADRAVDVGGVKIPLYLFLVTDSEPNLIQFFRYAARKEPPRAFYLDGLLALYDPLTDTVMSLGPASPTVISRYQRSFPTGEVLSSYHGITIYPRWFVEFVRNEVLPRLREMFDRYRALGRSKGFYTPGAPTVFVVFDSVNVLGRHLGYLDWLKVLTRKLRERGYNVVPIALHYDILYTLAHDFLKAFKP
ncbi:MAG: hypothetical protein ABGY09_04710, partial [Euryarchaeota archaeon]